MLVGGIKAIIDIDKVTNPIELKGFVLAASGRKKGVGF
jgi:hypothetical protein